MSQSKEFYEGVKAAKEYSVHPDAWTDAYPPPECPYAPQLQSQVDWINGYCSQRVLEEIEDLDPETMTEEELRDELGPK